MKSFRKGCVWAVIVFGFSLWFQGCQKKEAEEPIEVVRPVKTMVIQGIEGINRTYPGVVQGSQRVNLSFRVSGPLVELPIKEGDRVVKDQVLARIDPRDYDIAFAKAKAQYNKAESDFIRYQQLYEKDAVPLADLDLYRSQRDVAKAAYDDAESALNDTYLRAPFSGVVGETFVDNFEEVAAKEPIVSVNDLENIEIVINLPEYTVAKLKEGLDVKITASFEVAPGREFPLKIKEMSTQADATIQTYRATLTMPQPEGVNILPGMSGSVKMFVSSDVLEKINQASLISVPSTAVFSSDAGESLVWVVDENTLTVHQRPVTLGALTGSDKIQITEGLSAGERIAIAAVNQLREGTKISLME